MLILMNIEMNSRAQVYFESNSNRSCQDLNILIHNFEPLSPSLVQFVIFAFFGVVFWVMSLKRELLVPCFTLKINSQHSS